MIVYLTNVTSPSSHYTIFTRVENELRYKIPNTQGGKIEISKNILCIQKQCKSSWKLPTDF